MRPLTVTAPWSNPLNSDKTPPFLRRRLGRRLRAMREAAGLSMDEAAARLDKSRTSLHRIESGEYRADVHLIRSMMDVYDQWEEGLLEQTREANKPPWFRAYGVNDLGYIDVETYACRACEFCALTVPGLLQTEDYIRAMLASSRRKRTPDRIDNDIKVRLIRRRRLTSEDNPLELVAIIDESALRRQIGGPEVMRDQLGHLVEMANAPGVTVQVLPLNGPHSAMDGAFTLLEFPEPNVSALLYVEHAAGALHIEHPEKLRQTKLMFDQLRTEALSPADSITLIERIAGELDRP
jgi:transcriptional regulator with XRE-family HTH domain